MRIVKIGVLLTMTVLLGACAGGPAAQYKHGGTYYDDVDWAGMTKITRDAETRGARVYWVNPPQISAAKRKQPAEG